MRKVRWLVAGLAIVLLGACSSTSEPMAVQITGPLGVPDVPSDVSGAAADEGVVCSAVTFEQFQFVDLDGKVLSDEETDQLMQVEVETGNSVFSAIHNRWTCSDGSGSFVIVDHPILGMGDFDFEGVNDVSTWEIDSGAGDYEDLSGTGTVTVDFANGVVTYTGEMQNG